MWTEVQQLMFDAAEAAPAAPSKKARVEVPDGTAGGPSL